MMAATAPLDPVAADDLREILVRACQAAGFVTDHTYDLLTDVVASITTDPDEAP